MATVNEAFRNATGYHENLYRATEVVGYLAFAGPAAPDSDIKDKADV